MSDLWMVNRAFRGLDKDDFLVIYKLFIRPHLEYSVQAPELEPTLVDGQHWSFPKPLLSIFLVQIWQSVLNSANSQPVYLMLLLAPHVLKTR